MTPEQVNVEYLELSLKDLYSQFNPTEAILKSFYNENINSYTQPVTVENCAALNFICQLTPARKIWQTVVSNAESALRP